MTTVYRAPLIPRAALFGHPERFGGSISPDGAWLGWIAPHDGVANIWIAPRDRPDLARRLTDERRRGIQGFDWAFDGRHLLFAKDRDGDEQFHLHAVDRDTGVVRDLTPDLAGQSLLALASIHRPSAVVVSSNARDERFADLYTVELATGELVLLHRNEGDDGYLVDDSYTVRIAIRTGADGSKALLRQDGDASEPLVVFDPVDARVSGPAGLDQAGTTLFLLDSRGRDTAALTAIAIATGECRLVYETGAADIDGVIGDIRTYVPLACTVSRARAAWVVLDEAVRADVEQLDAAGIGDWSIGSRSADDRWWTIGAASDTRPGVSWLLDRETRALTELYRTRPALDGAPLAAMRSLDIQTRDGLSLVGYLTLPVGDRAGGRADRPVGPLPMVLSVHGGPWARDRFGFNAEHQWLANRGYAVLSVNFRGSTGFGKTFLAAGDGAWGAAMDDDLIDAVDWAIAEGIADPDRIAIMGASYGGYATLSAMTRFPTRFACGIDLVGPSNLETLLAATPPWWEAARAMLHRAIGDPATEEGRRLLYERSPLHRAGLIERPLLIGQGANDPRVRQAEAEQMAEAMRRHGVPVTYLLYPDEGHGFGRPQNALSFNAVREAFLGRWLGGRAESIMPADIAGSSMRIVDGEEWLSTVLPASEPSAYRQGGKRRMPRNDRQPVARSSRTAPVRRGAARACRPRRRQAIADHRAAMAACVRAHGFVDVFLAKERADAAMTPVWQIVSHLKSVADTPVLRAAYDAVQPAVSAYRIPVVQDGALFAAIAAIPRDGLSPAENRALDLTIRAFELSGVALDSSARALCRDQRRAGPARLRIRRRGDGCHPGLDAASRRRRKTRGHRRGRPGDARRPGRRSRAGGVADRPPCRQRARDAGPCRRSRPASPVYEAHSTCASDRGPDAGRFDNGGRMDAILALRQEAAGLLGFDTPVAWSLATRIARDGRWRRSSSTSPAVRARALRPNWRPSRPTGWASRRWSRGTSPMRPRSCGSSAV